MKYKFLLINLILPVIFIISCFPKPDDVLTKYIDAHNRHDIKNEINYYSNDITFEAVDVWIKKGKNEMRNLAEYDSVLNSELRIADVRVNGDTIHCKLIEKNDWFKTINIDSLIHDPVMIVIKNNLINYIRAELSAGSYNILSGRLDSLIRWMTVEKPDELQTLIPNGEFLYSTVSAKKWLNILKEWKEKEIYSKQNSM